jgi:hypothetical protein
MAIRALEGMAPEWYAPEGNTDDATRFKIRPLDGAEFGEIADYVTIRDSGHPMILAAGRDRCLKMALLDWENFNNQAGAVKCTPHNMRLIPHEYRVAIVNRILAISTLSEDEEKN